MNTQTVNNPIVNPSLLAEEASCDLCARKRDVIDMIPCPEKNGYYCPDCILEGDVSSYLTRMFKYDKRKITKFLNSIML